MKKLVAIAAVMWSHVCAVQAQGSATPGAASLPAASPPTASASSFVPPCLFATDDFTAILGRKPEAGVSQRDDRGISTCVYVLPGKELQRVTVQVHERFTQERFDMRVKTAQRIASARPILIADVGDGAFYVAGVAGSRRGLKYVEISGLRQAATRSVTPDDAASLLKLALERLPRF